MIKFANTTTSDSRVGSLYKYIFRFMVDVSISNSYILHKPTTTSTLYRNAPSKLFRLQLAKGLIGNYNSRKHALLSAAPSAICPPRQSSMLHFLVKKRTGIQKGVSRSWYCAHIRRPPVRKEMLWYCEECQLYLCDTGIPGSDCFMAHHLPTF